MTGKHFHMRVISAPPLPRMSILTARTGSKVDTIGVTVERPWLSNVPFKSCVSAGKYELIEYQSPTKNKWANGRVLVLSNPQLGVMVEPGPGAIRCMCQIHSANFPDELEGCIAPGPGFHPDRWGVASSSRDTCKQIFEYFDRGFNQLVIE